METFDFPLHTFAVRYPESSAKVKFGRGYEFASAPKGPDQLTVTLNFAGMFFYPGADGFPDLTVEPRINIAVLEQFYQKHRLYKKFIYPHPAKGNIVVRFSAPLQYKLKENGRGAVEPFSVEFLTQP